MPTGKVQFTVRRTSNNHPGVPVLEEVPVVDPTSIKPDPQLDFTVQRNSGYLLFAGVL